MRKSLSPSQYQMLAARLSLINGMVLRAVIMTSVGGLHGAGENPYHDRLEQNILTFTAAGKLGEQSITGANYRITEQKAANFPIHAFVLIASRRDKSVGPQCWKYLGLLEYLRHYPDTQLDAEGNLRRVWLFEFKIHQEPPVVPLSNECAIANEILTKSRTQAANSSEDDEIVEETNQGEHIARLEHIRGQLLAMAPNSFEIFVKDLLKSCWFTAASAMSALLSLLPTAVLM